MGMPCLKIVSASTVNFFAGRPMVWWNSASHAEIFTDRMQDHVQKETTVTTMTTMTTMSLSPIKFTLAATIWIQLTA
jgi:hypothetical protein